MQLKPKMNVHSVLQSIAEGREAPNMQILECADLSALCRVGLVAPFESGDSFAARPNFFCVIL
jgi:hypothetical protein